jgi:hypothetical protein
MSHDIGDHDLTQCELDGEEHEDRLDSGSPVAA